MFTHFQSLKRFTITQRQAALAVLALYFLGIVLVVLIELITPALHDGVYISGGLSGAVLFGSAWFLYFRHNWDPARHFAAVASSLLVGVFLPEPFVSQYAPMAVLIPTVLALILTNSFWVIITALLTISILLVRAGGSGVYTNPATLILYFMIVGGLLVRRLMAEASLRQLQEAQEAAKQKEKRFRALIENSSDEISILDASGTLIYKSPSSNPTLGYSSMAFVSKSFLKLVHPDDQELVQKILGDLIRDASTHPRERFRLLHKNSIWRWVEAVGTNLIGEPSVRGIVINYHDITERVQAEEQIQRQLKRLNGLRVIDIAIGSSLDLHVTLDVVLQQIISLLDVDACTVLLVNSELNTIECIASRGFHSDAPPYHDLDLGKGYARRAVDKRKVVHISEVMGTGSSLAAALHFANESFVDYFSAPLIVKGEVKGVLEIYHRSSVQMDPEWMDFLETLAGQAAIAVDNAQLFLSLQRANAELEGRVAERTMELNNANAELERANRTKDEFLANMSHELRTPLNSIIGLSESLLEQRRGTLNGNQQKSLEMIGASGGHLLELINDILDLSKIEAGKFDFYPQPVSLDEFCRSCLAFVKTQAYKKSITVTYIPEPFVSKIFADPRRLKQILVNLLINAVKFTSENGRVTLRVNADLEQDLIQFAVIDNGIGITPENLQRLFQPFVQVDSSLTRQYEGTGLGLTIVQKLTDLHGGSVQVQSKFGEGSCFTINLPCGQNEIANLENIQSETRFYALEKAEKTEIVLEITTPQATILLAEDNMSNVLLISEYLESLGYEIVVAHDGLEAIEKAETGNPDIILMDIQMPGINGLDAIARLRSQVEFVTIPIIALTALAMPGDRERCLLAGATEYMSKPVSLKSLKQMIENFLQIHPAF
jgi:PAS domain S-box-containing protein